MFRFTPILLTAALLSACQSEPAPDDVPDPDGEEVIGPSPEEPVSIIRPDIEEAVLIPLEPLNTTISFADSGTDLTPEAVAELETLVESRQVTEGGPITIGGHSDAGGNDAVNMRVSLRRAEAVRDWLVARGVDEGRITVIAFGEQNPVEPNALPDGQPNEDGRAANRRVEIRVDVPEGMMVEATPTPQATPSAAPVD
ncbi:OmpA family protein [Erythrobacter litoralis]|uniref:Outer membrane protein n=1 Tax=Erythrobacter litoralis (strain HTCC2594) TaxID=314225 RepID=Q2N667_ERYLH|nr:OmpA family protein [Erythrobacter litoralis]ABC64824.1 outer membrane protein [Erythrobacter litoralis HTCC2594]